LLISHYRLTGVEYSSERIKAKWKTNLTKQAR